MWVGLFFNSYGSGGGGRQGSRGVICSIFQNIVAVFGFLGFFFGSGLG